MASEKGDEPRNRGIYLLPNLLTTSSLFAGFYAIVAAMRGHYSIAAAAIFIAMVMDGLDGRVARLTNTQTAFGAQYDSLSDLVAFGIAPSLVIYAWALYSLGKIGWLVAFIYSVATALRLARFNATLDTADKRYFTGLPSPAAAGWVASTVWIGHEFGLKSLHGSAITAAIITVVAGVLMVSNIRYYSFKEFDMKGKVPFIMVLVVVLMFVIISTDPPQVLFYAFTAFVLSGPVMAFFRWRKMKRLSKRSNNN